MSSISDPTGGGGFQGNRREVHHSIWYRSKGFDHIYREVGNFAPVDFQHLHVGGIKAANSSGM